MNITGTAGIPVAHARRLWKPMTNTGHIDIQLVNGQAVTIPLDGFQEYLAVCLTLSEPHAVL
ncbi:hypothetical protein, partial [Deinococcus sp.]|uniref:hypothetical protein n=1 Tax=Deinococcus sp. TaxID=47478 RepID=UPI002869C4F2